MRRARAPLSAAALILCLSLGASTVLAKSPAAVYPPSAHPGGHSLLDLAEVWSDWAWQAEEVNPLLNPRCDYSGVGHVWFAPVSIGGFYEIDCTLPPAAKLFVTPGGYECSTAEGNGETLEELRACTEEFIGFICCVQTWVDGVEVKDIDRYLFTTRGQVLAGPNLLGPDDTLSMERGWFMLLRPMSVGHHTVVIYDAAPDFDLEFGLTINITVAP